MEPELEGKVAIITGGSEGIGFGIASSLAERGALVYLTARRVKELNLAKSSIEGNNGKVEVREADITDIERMTEIINEVYNTTGRLDFFINNAGAWKPQTISTSAEELRKMRQLTRDAPIEITEYLARKFKDLNKEIKILSVVSQAGIRYLNGNLGYGSGKKGLAVSLLELEGELAHHKIGNVKLYALYPATVATEKVLPAIRAGELQDATTLESVVQTAIDLLLDKTPTRHAYVGFVPGQGITRRYFDVKPSEFQMFPQTGEDEIVDSNFDPKSLLE